MNGIVPRDGIIVFRRSPPATQLALLDPPGVEPHADPAVPDNLDRRACRLGRGGRSRLSQLPLALLPLLDRCHAAREQEDRRDQELSVKFGP